MDLEQVSRQLVRAVRGKRSQRALSKRLGYRTNPVAEWEGGRRFPTGAELLGACERTGLDVAGAMGKIAPEFQYTGTDEASVARWLRNLAGQHPVSELANTAGLSRHTVSRALAGRTRPRLPQFLALIDACTHRLTDFVEALVAVDAMPALRQEHQRRKLAATLVYDQPWAGAIYVLAKLEIYRALPAHEEGWFAECLGIPLHVEQAAIEGLLAAGMMIRDGERLSFPPQEPRGYALQEVGDHNPVARLTAHWAGVAAQRSVSGKAHKGGFGWYGLSRDNHAKLVAMQRDFAQAAQQLAAQPQPQEHAVLLVTYLTPITGRRP
jgi:transcriptional regulator with XRE-family HTH domain